MEEILFDIDDTLIEVHKLSELIYQQIANETNTPIDKIIEAKEKYKATLKKGSDYVPEEMMNYICKSLNIDSSKMSNPFENENHYKKALFSETKNILKELSKEYTLGIFSEGFNDYQSKKIDLSGIGNYFNEELIFIGRRKLDLIKNLPNGVTIIDDKREVVEKLNEAGRFDVVWMNRKNEEKVEGVTTVVNLNEFVNYIKPRKNKIVS